MRFLRVFWTLSKYTFLFKFTSYRKENFGKRLRLAFEKLGITYIKIGQILSMRYDILSRQTCEELQQLLDNVSPIPIETIYAILEKEYGKPYGQVFAKFYEHPLGSASVSQVHKAVTFGGEVVAVKIKRPNVGEAFKADIKVMKFVARLTELFSPTLRNIQVRELVNYFESWIKQDLDFTTEVQNMKLVKEQYSFAETEFGSGLGRGVFVSPYEMLCTDHIIVMDYVEGIPLSNKEELSKNAMYDVEKSIKSYASAALYCWFDERHETYLFQADPHLSNIMALPGGDTAAIDCGLISRLTKKEAQESKDLIMAVYMQDIEKTLDIGMNMTGANPDRYREVLRPDIQTYLKQTRTEGFGFWFLGFAKIMVKHGLRFPLYLTTFGRANIMLDGLVNTYMPGHSTLDVLGDVLRQQAIKEAAKRVMNADWLQLAYAVSEKIEQAPKLLADFINDPLSVIVHIAQAVKTTTG